MCDQASGVIGILDYVSRCAGLFSDTSQALFNIEYFRLFLGIVIVMVVSRMFLAFRRVFVK